MKLRKIIAGLALLGLIAMPMVAGAAAKTVVKDDIKPATIKTVTDKYKGWNCPILKLKTYKM